MPATAAKSARLSRALRTGHPVDAAINARHVDLYDRPLTRAGSGRAHLARGKQPDFSDEGVARFLAATAR